MAWRLVLIKAVRCAHPLLFGSVFTAVKVRVKVIKTARPVARVPAGALPAPDRTAPAAPRISHSNIN